MMGVLFLGNVGGRAKTQGKGNTGAPGDETVGGVARTCQSCHGSSIQATTSIELLNKTTNQPITTYVPNDTYQLRVKINPVSGSPVGYGFQAVALNSANVQIPAWTNPASNVQIAVASSNGRTYAEHKGMSGSNTFLVDWKAPAAGTGKITFYAGGVAANGSNTDNGDGGSKAQLAITENTVSIQKAPLTFAELVSYPNPAEEELNLKLYSTEYQNLDIEIVNIMGQSLKQNLHQAIAGENILRISVRDLPTGGYILRIKGEQGDSITELFLKK
jgi:hypothetical protein